MPSSWDSPGGVRHRMVAADDAVRERLFDALRGQSYVDIARRTGLNVETIRRQLIGRSRLSIEVLQAIAQTYDISGHWILLGQGTMRPPRFRDFDYTPMEIFNEIRRRHRIEVGLKDRRDHEGRDMNMINAQGPSKSARRTT